MKKIFFVLIYSWLVTSRLFGSEQTNVSIFVGAFSANVAEQDATLYTVGYGWNKTYGNSVYLGGIFAFNFGETEHDDFTHKNKNITSYDVDLRVGYSFGSVAVFGIGAAVMQSLGNVSGYGFGYGAGASWDLDERWSLGTEYKTHSMTPENSVETYDYAFVTMRIGYSW